MRAPPCGHSRRGRRGADVPRPPAATARRAPRAPAGRRRRRCRRCPDRPRPPPARPDRLDPAAAAEVSGRALVGAEQLVEQVLGAGDHEGAVLEQSVGPLRHGGRRVARDRRDGAAELRGQRRRDHGPGPVGRLHEHGRGGQAGHDPVARGEAPAVTSAVRAAARRPRARARGPPRGAGRGRADRGCPGHRRAPPGAGLRRRCSRDERRRRCPAPGRSRPARRRPRGRARVRTTSRARTERRGARRRRATAGSRRSVSSMPRSPSANSTAGASPSGRRPAGYARACRQTAPTPWRSSRSVARVGVEALEEVQRARHVPAPDREHQLPIPERQQLGHPAGASRRGAR